MRFYTSFTRTDATIGTDAAPTAAPVAQPVKAGGVGTGDNQLSVPNPVGIDGWPMHRIAVAFSAPAGASPAPADLYAFEERTQLWFKVNEAKKMLRPGRLTFFDVVAILGQSFRPSSDPDTSARQGASDFAIVVGAPSDKPAGNYVVAMAPDLTTIGAEEPDPNETPNLVRAVTPSNSADLPDGVAMRLYCDSAGVLVFIPPDNADSEPITWNVAAGTYVQSKVRRVKATGTTVASIFALYT